MPPKPSTSYIELTCSKCNTVVATDIDFLTPQQYVALNGSIMNCSFCGFTFVDALIHKYSRRPFKLTQAEMDWQSMKDFEKNKDRKSVHHKNFAKKQFSYLFPPKKKYHAHLSTNQCSLDDFMQKNNKLGDK